MGLGLDAERQLIGEGDFGVGPLENGQPNADVIKGFVTAVAAGIFGGDTASHVEPNLRLRRILGAHLHQRYLAQRSIQSNSPRISQIIRVSSVLLVSGKFVKDCLLSIRLVELHGFFLLSRDATKLI